VKKIYSILLILFCLVFICAGCSSENNPSENISGSEQEEKVVLTERQIGILEDLMLPTEYEKLNSTQKQAIVSIEKMLTYLETTYDADFAYEGYWEPDKNGVEKMTASIEWYIPGKLVTVYYQNKGGEDAFTDDIINIMAEPYYKAALDEYIKEHFAEDAFRSVVHSVTAPEDVTTENVLEECSAAVYIFLDAEKYSDADVDAFMSVYGEWINEKTGNKKTILTYVFRASAEFIAEVNEYNCEDMIMGTVFEGKKVCSISPDSSVNIY